MVPPSKSVRRTSTRSRSSELRLCSASSRDIRGAVVWGEGKASCQGLGASVIALLLLSDKSECVPICSFHCVRRAIYAKMSFAAVLVPPVVDHQGCGCSALPDPLRDPPAYLSGPEPPPRLATVALFRGLTNI